MTRTHTSTSTAPAVHEAGPALRRGTWAALWAAAGVVVLFIEAAWRLAMRGIITIRAGLEPAEWLILAVLTMLFLYGEGVRALQRRWIPGVYRRIEQLRHEQRLSYRLLAPLYAMSLIGPTRQSRVRAWIGVTAIVAAVFIVRSMPEPWRGIIDIAVASALTWGILVLLYHSPVLFRSPGGEA